MSKTDEEVQFVQTELFGKSLLCASKFIVVGSNISNLPAIHHWIIQRFGHTHDKPEG